MGMDHIVTDPILDSILKDPAMMPEKDEHGIEITKCNKAVAKYLTERLGYTDFAGLLANQICAELAKRSEWLKTAPRTVQDAVNSGSVALAAHAYAGHSHVAVVAPESIFRIPPIMAAVSGRWKCLCPVVGNVGHANGYMTANWAFPIVDTPPTYYLYHAEKSQT